MLLSPVPAPLRITQHFGQHPEVYGQFGMEGHNGVDMTGDKSGDRVPVYAPAEGIITEAGWDDGYGNYVRLETPNPNPNPNSNPNHHTRQLVLAHFSELAVAQGDTIFLGDRLGRMGNTGFSGGVHLHLGLRLLDADGNVLNRNNGYKGYIDFEQYLLYWQTWEDIKQHISYPNDG